MGVGHAILLVDASAQVEEALSAAIGNRPYKVVRCDTADTGIRYLKEVEFDIVISGDELQGGSWLNFVAAGTDSQPNSFWILLATPHRIKSIVAIISDGRALALLQKPIDPHKLALVIDKATRARICYLAMNSVLDEAAAYFVSRSSPPSTVGQTAGWLPFSGIPGGLSHREWEVLGALVAGDNAREVARKFFLSKHTVRNHIKSMYRKLNVHTQKDLLSWYRRSCPSSVTVNHEHELYQFQDRSDQAVQVGQ